MLLGFFFVSVFFMTFLSISCTGNIKMFTKDQIMLWMKIALYALCMNTCVCILAHGMWMDSWNLFTVFWGKMPSTLSYQELFDISLMLMTMYIGSILVGVFLRISQRRYLTKGKSRNIVCLCLTSCWLLLVSTSLFIGIQGQRHILISEFYQPDKKTTQEDLNAYIEIANDGNLPYEVESLYLSDDENNLQKFRVTQTKISPKETILVPLDDNVFSFGRRGGDALILSNQYGEIIDEVITGDTRKNKSYTRNYKDHTWGYRDPSPGIYNLEKPQFSIAPGFYDKAFYVELYAEDHAEIYYTWDGSIPTLESEKYSERILIYDRSEEDNIYRNIQNVTTDWLNKTLDPTPVPKATVIRAIAVNEDGFTSEIATATYFVNQDAVKEKCVVSLVADPQDLFGPEGIYSTGADYDQWYLNGQQGETPKPNYEIHGLECSGNFEVFHGTSQGYLSQPCGIRIQGGSHRSGFLKRMSVFAREQYSGSEFFDQNIFGNRGTHSVALREGFENAFTMELVPQRSIATQKSFPVTVYLNGEYWYDTYLQEKYSDELFEEIYQLEDVEFIKAGVTEEMLTFVQENDMQTEDAYQRLNEMVDIQSYIDFMCANIYLANTDYSESRLGGNSAIWRSRKIEGQQYGDGRWRWALYDMDLITAYCRYELGMEDITDAEFDSFTLMRKWAGPLDERPFYSNLKKNPEFRKQFVLSFMDMVNTCFAPEFVESVLNKWGQDLSYNDSFFLNRSQFITQYLADSYDLTGTMETLALSVSDPNAGGICVNTCSPDLSGGSWFGTYYTDYPVTLAAQERDGYRFVRWEGDICSDALTITVPLTEGGVRVHAVFEKQAK